MKSQKEETPEKPDHHEDAAEAIQNALYSTHRFLTEECEELTSGILQCLKESGFTIVRDYVASKEPHCFKMNGAEYTCEIQCDECKEVVASKEVEADQFAIDFAEYMDTRRWRYDHQEQKTHTFEEHLACFKQCKH